MSHHRALLVAVVALASVAPSAIAADSASQRVKKLERRVKALERRVDALARLHLLTNNLGTRVRDAPMLTEGSGGFVRGSVTCFPGEIATGGGVLWTSPFAASNYVYFSSPFSLNGWQAGVNAAGAGGFPRVQVVCASLD